MRHNAGLILVLFSGTISLGLTFAAPPPNCNYEYPTAGKYCIDPFNKCKAFNSAPDGATENWQCPATYDDSQSVTPSCTASPIACDEYCNSSWSTKCSQVRKCKKKTGTNECIDDGASGPQSDTTYYFGDVCIDDCPES